MNNPAMAVLVFALSLVAVIIYAMEKSGLLWLLVFSLTVIVSSVALQYKRLEGSIDGFTDELRSLREQQNVVRRVTPEEFEEIVKETSDRLVERKLN